MSDAGFHARFAAVLRGGKDVARDGFVPEPGHAAALSVYRNTVVRGVIDVLGDNYPSVRFLAGDGNFAALAKSYWQGHPPHAGPMLLYGDGFADHLSHEAPRGMPAFLPAIARIDRAWGEAHHSADAPTLSPGDIRTLDADGFSGLFVDLHPSVRRPAHDRPILTTWTAARFQSRVERAGTQCEETVLVWRPAMEVRYRTLSATEIILLNALDDGLPLGEAAHVSGASPDLFIRLLKDGVFARDRHDRI